MSISRIAGRYAKSLFDLATEQGKLANIVADVDGLRTAFQNRDLVMMFKSPVINAEKKASIVNAIFEGKVDATTLAFMQICVSKGREGLLPEIVNEFTAQHQQMLGITKVKITSAAPLSEAVLAQIKAKFTASSDTAQSLDIVTAVNHDLIGGYVVEFDDKLYDASVKNKLANLKKEFMGA